MKIGRSVSSAVAAHAALDTGVHGVGASTVLSAIDIAALIATHAALFTGLHGTLIVPKTADETVNNSAAMQNDNELVLAMGANEDWLVEVVLYVVSATATPDIDYLFTVPVGATFKGIVSQKRDEAFPFGSLEAETLISAVDATTKYCHFKGKYTGGASAGSLQLQWAQNVATVEDTKILANSFMIAHRIV